MQDELPATFLTYQKSCELSQNLWERCVKKVYSQLVEFTDP